jgi:hypothetical protein
MQLRDLAESIAVLAEVDNFQIGDYNGLIISLGDLARAGVKFSVATQHVGDIVLTGRKCPHYVLRPVN